MLNQPRLPRSFILSFSKKFAGRGNVKNKGNKSEPSDLWPRKPPRESSFIPLWRNGPFSFPIPVTLGIKDLVEKGTEC